MNKKEYYKRQDDLTAAKIEIYQNYIESYLIKLLMGFGKCFIADLFCGAGKNGDELGSPLVLLDRAKYILTIPKLKNNSQIYIIFNDIDKNNIQNLEKELKKIEKNENINIYPVQNKNFKDILPEVLRLFKNIPAFFFLDPFTYSKVKISHLKKIMSLKFPEVLLFLPIFHSYRFASNKKFKNDHRTRIFVEEFTTKGIYDYKNIDDFMESIKDKLRQEINLGFVRSILLNYGSRKNSLFLLTKNQEGILLMNKIAFDKSEDGAGINIKNSGVRTLFGTKGTRRFGLFEDKLISELNNQKQMTNLEIIKFTIAEGFLPKHAKDILIELIKSRKVKVFDQSGREVIQTNRFYISKDPVRETIFKYIA